MTEPQPIPHDETTSDNEAGSQGDAPKSEIATLKDQLLRALAEAENTRRRAQKERDDTAKYAVSNFAREMLNVADTFSRALEATPKETDDAGLKNLVTGLEATDRQLQSALERFGIKKMEPLGQPFDPNFHRVMMEIEDAERAPGTIVQVLQTGYMIHDRLLREALVAVSKGKSSVQGSVDTSV